MPPRRPRRPAFSTSVSGSTCASAGSAAARRPACRFAVDGHERRAFLLPPRAVERDLAVPEAARQRIGFEPLEQARPEIVLERRRMAKPCAEAEERQDGGQVILAGRTAATPPAAEDGDIAQPLQAARGAGFVDLLGLPPALALMDIAPDQRRGDTPAELGVTARPASPAAPARAAPRADRLDLAIARDLDARLVGHDQPRSAARPRCRPLRHSAGSALPPRARRSAAPSRSHRRCRSAARPAPSARPARRCATGRAPTAGRRTRRRWRLASIGAAEISGRSAGAACSFSRKPTPGADSAKIGAPFRQLRQETAATGVGLRRRAPRHRGARPARAGRARPGPRDRACRRSRPSGRFTGRPPRRSAWRRDRPSASSRRACRVRRSCRVRAR